MCANFGACFQKRDISVYLYLVAVILKNGRHFEFWNFFRWLTGFIKRAISKEYVCQFWCLFPEMKDSFTYLPHYKFLKNKHKIKTVAFGYIYIIHYCPGIKKKKKKNAVQYF